MLCRVLVVTVFASACATARYEPQADDGTHDAAVQGGADAAHQTGDASTASADASSTGTCASAMTGVLATYSFSGATGTQASTAASSTTAGMVAGSITRSATLTAVTGATSINSSNWPLTPQLDATKYYTLTLTPPSGCKLSLTSATIDTKASSTGPAMASVATNADAYAATVALATSGPSSPALAVVDATGAVEIRFYGYAATSTAGTFRLQNTLTVSGSLK
jgi:hypothetical protein